MAQTAPIDRPRATNPAEGLPDEVWSEPMGESGIHGRLLTLLLSTLWWYLRDRIDVYVGGNLPVQYDPADLRRHLVPDVFVTLGLAAQPLRDSFATWIEGKGLDLVIELTSPSTARRDAREKLAIYQDRLDVQEYVLFDPLGETDPRLRLFRRRGRLLVEVDLAGSDRVELETLPLDAVVVGDELRLWDRAAGALVPYHNELGEKALRAEAELDRAVAELDGARAELARAEAERQRAEADRQRAEAERQRLDDDRRREEAARRDAEERVTALEAELRRLRGESGA